jgi:hypothetical protein
VKRAKRVYVITDAYAQETLGEMKRRFHRFSRRTRFTSQLPRRPDTGRQQACRHPALRRQQPAKETTMADIDRKPLATRLGTHVLSSGLSGYAQWHAERTRDSTPVFEAGTFSVRRGSEREEALDLSQPFLLDALHARIGWLEGYDRDNPRPRGQAPAKHWWKDRNVPEPRPPGGPWKQAIQCSLITADGERLLWEQSSAGAVRALIAIYALLDNDPQPWFEDEVPALRHVGGQPAGSDKYKTLVAEFAVTGRVPRPADFDRPLPDDQPRQSGNSERPVAAPSKGPVRWDAPEDAGRWAPQDAALTDDEIPFA